MAFEEASGILGSLFGLLGGGKNKRIKALEAEAKKGNVTGETLEGWTPADAGDGDGWDKQPDGAFTRPVDRSKPSATKINSYLKGVEQFDISQIPESEQRISSITGKPIYTMQAKPRGPGFKMGGK